MKRIYAICLAFWSLSSLAADIEFMYDTVEKAQQLNGISADTNVAWHLHLTATAFSCYFPEVERSEVVAHAKRLITELLQCVFLKETDMSDFTQKNHAKEMAAYLMEAGDLTFYHLSRANITAESVESAPCALAVKRGNFVLVLQGERD
jgi:hypothetical protein